MMSGSHLKIESVTPLGFYLVYDLLQGFREFATRSTTCLKSC